MLIQLDTHFHTVASTHAYSTVKEIASSAAEKGLKGFAMTDHAPSMGGDAPHIWHFRNMKVIPDYIHGVRVIKGVEANITDFDGNIDMDESDLQYVDWVIASYHSSVVSPETMEINSQGYINAAKNNPRIDVMGHPGSFGFEFDIEKVLLTFKEYDKLVEINESAILYKKGAKQINTDIIRICKKYDIPVIVNSDGHYCDLVGDVSVAEGMIREIGLPEKLVVNADAQQIYERIKSKRPNFTLERF